MNASHHTTFSCSWQRLLRPARSHLAGPRGFTITELLVVIAIIILLAGILLVALGRVRTTAMRTTTMGTMQSFAQACDAFQTEHQQYPGVIPERVLARAIAGNGSGITLVAGTGSPSFTSTENALLHLMGGYRVVSPSDIANKTLAWNDFNEFDIGTGYHLRIDPGTSGGGDAWELKINLRQIGEGPVINRQQFAPYYTPSPEVIGNVSGQVAADGSGTGVVQLPDLIDAWGQPILYFRRTRESGPLAGSPAESPQFYLQGAQAYLQSTSLGEQARDQDYNGGSNPSGSVLSEDLSDGDRFDNFAQLLRHPSFGRWGNVGPLDPDNVPQVRARGAYVLISAGPDGIFFSASDGPGRPGPDNQVTDLTDDDYNNPQSIEEYDDIRIFGGG